MKSPRRGFLKALAAAPIVPAAATAQSPAPGTGVASPPAAADDVAAALAEAVRRQFGEHLDAGELDEVRREIERGRNAAKRLRAAAGLTNSDAPVTRFEARPPARGGR